MPQACLDLHFSNTSLIVGPFEIEKRKLSFSGNSPVALRYNLLPSRVNGLMLLVCGLIVKVSTMVGTVAVSHIVISSVLESVVKVMLMPKSRNSLRDVPDTNH